MTLNIVIDKSLIGCDYHLRLTGNDIKLIDSVDEKDWYLTGQYKQHGLCFDSLLKLNNLSLDLQPQQKFVKALRTLVQDSHWPPPWKKVLEQQEYKKFIKKMIDDIRALEFDITYYDVFKEGNDALALLKNATINETLYLSYCLKDGGNSHLRSFKPDDNKKSCKITYDRFGSRTGRLTVKDGPMILSLNKEYRDILCSRHGVDGNIVMLDFNALEVRVLLNESENQPVSAPDIYTEFNNELFLGKLSRDIVKSAVISLAYGQSIRTLSTKLNLSADKTHFFVDKISKRLRLTELATRLKSDYVKNGWIKNRFGRIVNVDDPSDNVLVNSYAQSTGADIALLGFKNVIQQLGNKNVEPLFFLMDALILDVHKDSLNDVRSLNKTFVKGYTNSWPLKLSFLS